ncbi:3-hydroxyacyl-CoA dehydrogenase [Massilia sp. Root351]|jgi:3-hydroxybutyryl-CoA dehydrogenase|uniref:3-hydroxyacyl-CoA dehydrogenase n=1 Tax=Massilia sp. Root351 TaxID=1736522 RepID=UPI00070F9E0F|nr:3-hydroxyacyl-CoA dehydrogenase [Massilia sp. Root351]KQV86301.1 3-hydroxyacyl-CoA dehydrogenase [Massilia sp. Root351]
MQHVPQGPLTQGRLTLGVAGAGAMGRGIAQVAAQAGIDVYLYDVQDGAAAKAVATVRGQLATLAGKGKLTAEAADAAGAKLHAAPSLQALADCGIVIEAIVEQLESKRALFDALEGIVRPGCVLATNTSSLSVTAIAAGARLPDRIAGCHFFNPVPLMKVVEVISGALTGAEATQALTAFVRRLGHTPVQASDTPGFIVNHAGRGYLTEALRIVQERVASFEQVDTVLRGAAGFRLGPFQLLDLTGLDVSHPVMESIYRQYYQEPRYRPSPITAQRLAAGLLGKKTGQGFYRYDGDSTAPQAAAPAAANAGAPISSPQPWTGPIWIDTTDADTHASLASLLRGLGAFIDISARPSASALCLVAPWGEDTSASIARLELDAGRTLGIDPLCATGTDGAVPVHATLMLSPATDTGLAGRLLALFEQGGHPATLINDSAGFIVQRVLATIINIGCDIVQQGICTPADLDSAVTLGLGYPRGPLAWGDHLGPQRVLAILRKLQQLSGDPRYRPSPWLVRRAQLGLSLLHTNGAREQQAEQGQQHA